MCQDLGDGTLSEVLLPPLSSRGPLILLVQDSGLRTILVPLSARDCGLFPPPAPTYGICFSFLSGIRLLLSLYERRIWAGWRSLFPSHSGNHLLALLRDALDLLPNFQSSSWALSGGLWKSPCERVQTVWDSQGFYTVKLSCSQP